IGDRSFSNDPQSVIRNAAAVISGYEQAGILPVLKHFPGHGSASQDSHMGLATTPDLEVLRQVDLLPYQALLKDNLMVMVGHLWIPDLTDNFPASLSSAAVEGLLRDELGFNGIVITDALGMGAITEKWPILEAAILAINAGVNVVMVSSPQQVSSLLDGMEASLVTGELDHKKVLDSVERVFALKAVTPCQLVESFQSNNN
ncbi:MAG: glycoside hydrolase family 3 N-terminal domain-containing protein, partial [Actinomycetota bacterium]|nr:glycoside hydrolase family 3 N-terminal domain-containing protein [Actinomycetota bacterium]